jgi:hypothetical protein
MTSANAAQSALHSTDTESATAGQGADDVGAHLAVVATLLRETVVRFEETVGRITETAVMRARPADRDLIVTLQDFDRLQQEFMALGDVIAHVAATTSGSWSGRASADHQCRQAIAAISVADLKNRFLRHLSDVPTDLAASQASDDVVF